MLIIRKGETNNLIATVSMNKTLPNPYYLFSFQHIASKERVSFIPQVIVSNTRYDKFRFVEGATNLSLTPPQAFFNYIGQYYYSIYEQTSSGNTDIALAYNKLESGRAVVIVGDSQTDECLFEPYISTNEDAYSIIYVSEQEEYCITGGTPTPTPVTPTPTPTPTSTPLTPTPLFESYLVYTGSTECVACLSSTSLTLYGPSGQLPVLNLFEFVYVDSGLTIPVPNDTYIVQLSQPLRWTRVWNTLPGQISQAAPNGCLACITPTPTPTPTITPTNTLTPTPTPTAT